jgi:steroid 5-alpha reductase family enzyme
MEQAGGQPQVKFSRISSFGLVVLAYITAVSGALFTIAVLGVERPFATLVLADLLATAIVFAFSMALNNGSVYDPYWSVIPPFMALYWLGNADDGADGWRQTLVVVLVFAWGIRLTFNWARGWPGLHHEDWRYVDLYRKWPTPKWVTSAVAIHFLPTIQVLIGSLALIPALARGSNALNLLDALAWLVTAGAILIETVADEQLRDFNRTKQPGDIMDRGLWAYSRHPNYFGELSFWWGLFLFAIAADASYWWTIVGPLAMMALFHFASVPMLDERSLRRRPGYAEHMRRVSAIIPWARKDEG